MTAPVPSVLARAAIVAVGSELLETTRLDTNSLFITEQLNTVGIDVISKHVAGDDRAVLSHVLRSALTGVDLLVVCGGLGPTDDDLTREVVADLLARPLAESAALVEYLERRYASRGLSVPMPLNNLRQAMVPQGADVIDNSNGSAPGLWIDYGAQTVVLLPGPPRELKPMMTALAASRLRARASGVSIVRRTLRITGRFESHVDQALHPLYEEWAAASPPVAATILASLGQIEVHLSVRHSSREQAAAILERATAQARGVIGEDVFSTDGRRLEEVVGEALAASGLWIAAAESCTGGLVTSRLTDVSGSSRYVGASIVAYANEAKTSLLGVPDAGTCGPRRSERAGRPRHGRRHPVAGRRRPRPRHHRYRGPHRRHAGKAGGHRCRRLGLRRWHLVADVPLLRRPRAREVPGLAGRPRSCSPAPEGPAGLMAEKAE